MGGGGLGLLALVLSALSHSGSEYLAPGALGAVGTGGVMAVCKRAFLSLS